jgi:hypothetical protein
MSEYVSKIKVPIYEIRGEKPKLSELVDHTVTDNLIQKIDTSIIPDGIKSFLRIAATRHYKFNYANIAEYYANSSSDVQELFEQSGLVIIDFDDAIANGFVKMNKRLMDIRRETSE